MKREVKMTFNPHYAELTGRELHKIRLKEAEHQRLIRYYTLANPSTARKIWLLFLDRWQNIWNRKQVPKRFVSVSR